MERKVYVVMYNDCPESQIEAIFSTKEKAEEFLDTKGDEYIIEEWPVDSEFKKENNIYCVEVIYGSGIILNSRISFQYEKKDCVEIGFTMGHEVLRIYVESDSSSKANKIAAERYADIKRNEKEKYPHLQEKCVIFTLFPKYYYTEYPIYHYPGGEIVLHGDRELKKEFANEPVIRNEEML